MTSKEFINWCQSVGIEEPRVVKNDLVSIEFMYEAWNYQQKKLQAADEKIASLDWQYKELMERRKQVRILREAVEFYADFENFTIDKNHMTGNLFIEEFNGLEWVELGKKARQALEKMRKG